MPPTTNKPAPMPAAASQTRPYWYNPLGGASTAAIPRRSLDEKTAALAIACFAAGNSESLAAMALREYAATFPLRMLLLLLEKNPILSDALAKDLGLAFAPGDTKIVAVKPGAKDDQGRDVIDDGGTAEIADLWGRSGGLESLQRAIGKWLTGVGQAVIEAVPAVRGQGIADVFTADPLRCRFRQGDTLAGEDPLVLQTRTNGGAGATGGKDAEIGSASNGWRDLSSDLVFSVAIDATRDNPYGVPRYSAALDSALANMRIDADLVEVLHDFVLPRLSAGFPIEQMIEYAKVNTEVLQPLDPAHPEVLETPAVWAQRQFIAFRDMMMEQSVKDVFVYMKGGEVAVLDGAAGLKGAEGVLDRIRHNVILGTHVPPAMLGITDGGTQAYSEVQLELYGKLLEHLRSLVNGVLVAIANLHFRLRGLALTARADTQPIFTGDATKDAAAEKSKRENIDHDVRAGFLTIEEASVLTTGSGVADMARAEAYYAAPAPTTDPTDPATDPTTNPTTDPADPGRGENP